MFASFVEKFGEADAPRDMARMARAVLAGVPHHLTQRGVARQQVFFSDTD